MTAICGGGSSQAKPQVDPLITISSVAAGALVSALGFPELDFIVGLAAGGAALETATFCSQDPPPDPGLTAQDAADALNYASPEIQLPALARFKQWFESQYWYTICQCSSTPTPAPPPPSNPGPVGNSPGVPGGSGSTCYSASIHPSQQSQPPNVNINLTNQVLPITGPTVSMFAGDWVPSGRIDAVPIPTGVSSWNATAAFLTPAGLPLEAAGLNIVFGTADGTPVFDDNLIQVGNYTPNRILNHVFPSGATHWGVYTGVGSSFTQNLTLNYQLDLSFNCTGGNFQSPCCPPDPLLDAKLNALIGRINEIWALVSAGQGHGAYVDSVRHANLSGNGTITIEPSSSAIRLEIKTDLSSWPHNPQTPNYFYSLGFVTPFAVGTPLRGQRLIYNNQTFSWPTYTDQIGYSLAPGLVVDLVELTR